MEKLRGTVKFYNSTKGFGFIYTTQHYSDVFFHINDWKNPSAPSEDDDVEFELVLEKAKYKAVNVVIIKTSSQKKQDRRDEVRKFNDDRIVCPGCGKKIVPRMITFKGTPSQSVCPFCAAQIKNFSGCFIATAVYEDYNHPQVIKLRKFRDEYLLTNKLGVGFVNVYYKYSPAFANFVKGKKLLSSPIKKLLDGFVYLLKKIKD